jgi:ABC-type Fe3+ transport system substrate-binding protein
MAYYTTKVKWTRSPHTEDEAQAIIDYMKTQEAGNGVLTDQPDGHSIRVWKDEASANAFAEFAKTVQANQEFPTTVVVTTVA